MKVSEFKRWLRFQGCAFEEGKAHTKVMRGKLRSTLPRHPSKELRTGTMRAILKQLGLDGKEPS
ncbi:MAG: type II toxin-antitoxin system HicA family toxin [Acidobacteria bacterium]|nr:type II toxin-antitoxin system HicA family toxin [Acidobacteriota bacterium]